MALSKGRLLAKGAFMIVKISKRVFALPVVPGGVTAPVTQAVGGTTMVKAGGGGAKLPAVQRYLERVVHAGGGGARLPAVQRHLGQR